MGNNAKREEVEYKNDRMSWMDMTMWYREIELERDMMIIEDEWMSIIKFYGINFGWRGKSFFATLTVGCE